MARMPMTPEGYEALKAELHRLKTVERPNIIEAIAEARAHGDLSENAEYDAAKDKQGFIEGRIREVETKLAQADVIDPTHLDLSKVVFGVVVDLLDLDSDEEVSYKLVGEDESDPRQGKLSIQSPVARALLGKAVGDEVDVQVPGGERAYEILSIRAG